MLKEKMYVRCPADREDMLNPRVFICGQITKIDEFERTVKVKIHDPFQYLGFFDNLPCGTIEVPSSMVEHCSFFVGSEVMVDGECGTIISLIPSETSFHHYYVQFVKDKHVLLVSESKICASFNNGSVDPASQLERYEFQNPAWYIGHSIVSRSMNILENSICGFKELAGSKIYLLPHQVNTIMRCLQEKPCRYMLADEVGMGKTIEAISVLKIFMKDRANISALIIVPETLKEQWKTELLLKFNLPVGTGKDKNAITLLTIEELSKSDESMQWDFTIVDEVHRYIKNSYAYTVLHRVSQYSKNILLLSATPVQQRADEYLNLLRLLEPQKYDSYTEERFNELVNKQNKIIQKTALILDDLDDYEEEIENTCNHSEDPHNSEDCEELYEEIREDLEAICSDLKDDKLSELLEKVNFDSDDLGVYQIKVVISYVCSNYQVESHIIRNRRKILESEDHLLPTRKLITATYQLDQDRNNEEATCYQKLSDWLIKNVDRVSIEEVVRPLLGAFFSSSWAFCAEIERVKNNGELISLELEKAAVSWRKTEEYLKENISAILDDPDSYENEYCSRMITVANLLYEELYDKKVVVFTSYPETFHAYKEALSKVFSENEFSAFGAEMPKSEAELNAYRFQNEPECRIMLCDYTGGEGRNFQCADDIIHVDLPWDASVIEQRIGRLDRLERDPLRSNVYSVVIYTEETFEAALFDFWSKGLKIFTHSLSGMEIIMSDINQEIVSAVKEDFRYGLFDRVPEIIKLADTMQEAVRKEQNYDAAGFIFRPMYAELKRLIEYYGNHENLLFANAMSDWASLAGFRGFNGKDETITYTAASFSPASAINAQLIPPRWNEYLQSEQNQFVTKVQEQYDKVNAIRRENLSIHGTFIRKRAIESDYLHFFAPGDEVFECIVNNSMRSCKGRSAAFAVPAKINWKGLVFTWSISPDENILLNHGVSVYALGPYRNYLTSEQIIVPISIENKDESMDDEIVREYIRIISAGIHQRKPIHLGKRNLAPGFLRSFISGQSNISWFKQNYSEEAWHEFVSNARQLSLSWAEEQFKRKSNIRGAREEMERVLSSKVANQSYYGIDDVSLEQLKKEQEIILKALENPRITLDSAAFVWMVKAKNEQS